MISARTPHAPILPSQHGTIVRRSHPHHEAFEDAAAQLRPAWAHVWPAALADASGLRDGGAVGQATLDYSFDAPDQQDVDRYRATLERDFRLQQPRLLRWVAILVVTGVGLLWGLSTTAASDPLRAAPAANP